MASYIDEDFADLIRQEAGFDWDKLKKDLPRYPAAVLIDIMTELGLYVNKQLAQEIAKRDNAVFYLRKLLQDGKHWRDNGPGGGWSPLHAIHILALIKSREAFELLLDIIRYHEDDLNDWLTENVTSLLVAFGEDFIDPLKEFTRDETLETFARSAAASALVALGKEFPEHQNDIKQHLIKLLRTTQDGTFAGLVADDLASFQDPSVMPEIHMAFEDGIIDDPFVEEDELEEIVNGVFSDMDEAEFKRNTRDPLNYFSRENIEHLHENNSDIDKDFESEVIRPLQKKEKIGRNEPCPCGSGKKYKKCCLGKEKS